ncbi:peptidoglycan -binding protein [Roseospirillum parvum]|uniref:Chemotaxis protein MotB n=1 Tax=Roseospirillum parvum TaxID=83401 RepID=A0A1G8D001_9PROT|nr:peptidoglycan -binding protein [Roseospirillum parvum]SDH51105.1 chemotaxis protein MotB [Roseospirillum parvum]
MGLASRRQRRATDIWPGFVDALASLLMILIFVLLVFVLGQFFLGQALSGRDDALAQLSRRVNELASLLSLERQANEDLRLNLAQISGELEKAGGRADDLAARLEGLEDDNSELSDELRDRLAQIARLENDVKALEALKAEMQAEVRRLNAAVTDRESELESERELSAEARAQAALLNQQLEALRAELARLNEALDAAEAENAAKEAQIADLGNRLNRALASKVQELQKYRSEFFGRLRQVLGARDDIRIEGDRFVFQSEILFESASATLGEEGKTTIAQLADTLLQIAAEIPDDVNWILRVDGHTDRVPINNERFASNWELSAGRAISVVNYLVSQGVPPNRLVAAGFGEFQPLDPGRGPEARRRNRRIEFKLDQR